MRLFAAAIMLAAAIGLGAASDNDLADAWRLVSAGTGGEDMPRASTRDLFERLQPQFRDHETYSRDIRLMRDRSEIDGRYLAAIAEMRENVSTIRPETGGIGSLVEAFGRLKTDLALEDTCSAGNPWSAPVSTARRDVDSTADGTRHTALDLLVCMFTVPRGESGIFRYPIATVALAADASRSNAAIHAAIGAEDARKALTWLDAVLKGEVAHLQRLLAIRQGSTTALAEAIDGSLVEFQAASRSDGLLAIVRLTLLSILTGTALLLVITEIRSRRH